MKSSLHNWRTRRGWSQRRAAAELGCTLTSYQQWESGVSRKTGRPTPPTKTVLLAAAALEHGLKPVSEE